MKIQPKPCTLLVLIVLVLTSLSCNLAREVIQDDSPTETPIPVSTEAVETLATEVSSVISTAQAGGDLVLEVTEEQLTSAATTELQASGETRIRNLQIRLRDGKMIITGDVEQGGLTLPLSVALRFIIDAQGRLHSQVVEANIGPFSVPDKSLAEITTQLDQTLMKELDANASNLVVDSITIADGRMTIIAHQK